MAGTYKVNGDRLTGLTVYSTLPVGTVIATVSTSEVGFLAFDGSEYNGADYPELYNKVKNLTAFQSETEGYFKLPNLAGRTIQQAESELGVLVEAGLPNITGSFSRVVEPNSEPTGAFKKGNSESAISGGTSARLFYVDFSARDGETDTDGNIKTSGQVFGNSNTVQPPAITLNFLIKATDYVSLPQNAIDDARVTNANTYSAEKVMSEIGKASDYNFDEEVIVGYVIKNGVKKPRYRKGIIASSSDSVIATLSDVEEVITISGVLTTDGNEQFAINSPSNTPQSTYFYSVTFNTQSKELKGYVQGSYLSGTAKIIIEYTKTTD